VRFVGFAHQPVFRTSVVRWILIAALASAASACSGVPDSTTDKAGSAESLRAGDAAREKGDLDTAAADYAKAASANPRSLQAQLRLGAISLARKDEDSAYNAYAAAQDLAPKDPEAAFRLGEIDLTRGDAKAAADQFGIALMSRNDDPKLYNVMGVALAMQGKYQLAQQNYDRGLALAPDYPALRNNYGMMQLASGDLSGALATFSALVASYQASDRYRLNRALVELAMGRTETALADAPGMDEAGLRQTLAIYFTPPQDKDAARSEPTSKPPVGGATTESSKPGVHLAVDPPAAASATGAINPTSLMPVALLPSGTSR
jgi:Flp pilus assembly protein TadD